MGRNISNDRRSTILGAKWALFLFVAVGLVALAPQASAAEKPGSYLALKAGIYSPSATFNLANVDIETTFDGDTRTGFSGEIAFGHYFLPTLALELGAGFFKGKGTFRGTATEPSREMDFNVVPIIFSAKALIPVGPVDPYGELGIGAYFTKLNVDDNLNTFDGTTTFGIHTGAGLNVNVTPMVFIGLEGRYVWANPSFGGQQVKLNDREYALNGFKLNGFTSTLALGYSF